MTKTLNRMLNDFQKELSSQLDSGVERIVLVDRNERLFICDECNSDKPCKLICESDFCPSTCPYEATNNICEPLWRECKIEIKEIE